MALNVHHKKRLCINVGSGLARILLLLTLSALLLRVCASTSQDANATPRGIRAKLIHKDQLFAQSFGNGAAQSRSRSEKILDGAKRTALRVQRLHTVQTKKNHGKADPDYETPLSDLAEAEYLMNISLGTPAQNFVAVADTGSDLTWLQCLPCKHCLPRADPAFDPSLSSTLRPLSCSSSACEFISSYAICPFSPNATDGAACPYSYGYADQSNTTGTLVQDTINLETSTGGMQSIPNFGFGCSHSAYSSSGLYEDADGLVGLGRGLTSLPSQLGEHFGRIFGYCLVDRLADHVEASPLIFGDAAVPAADPSNGLQLQYTPLNESGSTFYFVTVEAILLNGVALPISNDAFLIQPNGTGGTFFDSGTTYSSFVSEAYDALEKGLSDAITRFPKAGAYADYFKLCYNASWEEWAQQYGASTPKISFKFAEATPYDLEVSAAWVEVDVGFICLAIFDTGFSSGSNIIGNVQQTDFHIVYDLQQQRLGFIPADCDNL